MISRDQILRRIRYSKRVQYAGTPEVAHAGIKPRDPIPPLYRMVLYDLPKRYVVSNYEMMKALGDYIDSNKLTDKFRDNMAFKTTGGEELEGNFPGRGSSALDIMASLKKHHHHFSVPSKLFGQVIAFFYSEGIVKHALENIPGHVRNLPGVREGIEQGRLS